MHAVSDDNRGWNYEAKDPWNLLGRDEKAPREEPAAPSAQVSGNVLRFAPCGPRPERAKLPARLLCSLSTGREDKLVLGHEAEVVERLDLQVGLELEILRQLQVDRRVFAQRQDIQLQ
jgi:hypothetical protein